MADLLESLGLGGILDGGKAAEGPMLRIPMGEPIFTADEMRRRCAEANLEGRIYAREQSAKIAEGLAEHLQTCEQKPFMGAALDVALQVCKSIANKIRKQDNRT